MHVVIEIWVKTNTITDGRVDKILKKMQADFRVFRERLY